VRVVRAVGGKPVLRIGAIAPSVRVVPADEWPTTPAGATG